MIMKNPKTKSSKKVTNIVSLKKDSFVTLDEMATRLQTERVNLLQMIFQKVIPPILDETSNFVVNSQMEEQLRHRLRPVLADCA
jgi:hypothetical protein